MNSVNDKRGDGGTSPIICVFDPKDATKEVVKVDLIEVKKDVIHTTVGDRLAVPKQTFEWLIEQAEKVVKMECEYCSDYTKKVPEMHGKKSWFSLYEHYMEVADTHEFLSFKIKYCPMCGKNLGDGK